jgi:outer membrane protein assembly factor BamD
MVARPSRLAVLTLLFAVGSVAASGCATAPPPPSNALQYSEDARRAYEKALEAFLDKDWEEAGVLLNEVKRKYAYSKYARLAELRLADIDFEQEKFATAITAYRSFAHDHASDDSVPYARFRIARAIYNQVSDTVLLPPQEERDQGACLDAYRELSAFVFDYPTGKWSKDARYMLMMVTSRLVRHELYVGRYYLDRDKFEPALKRAQFALATYEGSGLEPEAMVLIGEIYLKMKKNEQAREVLTQVIAVYPSSPFAPVAERFLAEAKAKAQ